MNKAFFLTLATAICGAVTDRGFLDKGPAAFIKHGMLSIGHSHWTTVTTAEADPIATLVCKKQ